MTTKTVLSVIRSSRTSLMYKMILNVKPQQTAAFKISHRNMSTVETNNSNKKEQEAERTTTPNEDKLTNEIEVLTNEIKTLQDKNTELLDKYQRSLADKENLRTRMVKQIDDAKIFSIQGFCKDLLEVADVLGHATQAVPKEELTDKNPHLKNLYEGLDMTKASLMQVFKRHGVEVVNPVNEKFNPNFHEAMFQVEVAGSEPNTVIEVSKIGYKLRERCIRPALVGVSKN